jgi:hypothetical protein
MYVPAVRVHADILRLAAAQPIAAFAQNNVLCACGGTNKSHERYPSSVTAILSVGFGNFLMYYHLHVPRVVAALGSCKQLAGIEASASACFWMFRSTVELARALIGVLMDRSVLLEYWRM